MLSSLLEAFYYKLSLEADTTWWMLKILNESIILIEKNRNLRDIVISCSHMNQVVTFVTVRCRNIFKQFDCFFPISSPIWEVRLYIQSFLLRSVHKISRSKSWNKVVFVNRLECWYNGGHSSGHWIISSNKANPLQQIGDLCPIFSDSFNTCYFAHA